MRTHGYEHSIASVSRFASACIDLATEEALSDTEGTKNTRRRE
jgi:hypothetical protein